MPIAELDDIPLTCKVSPLTRLSTVVCLYQVAIPDDKVPGTRKYGHSGKKNEMQRLLNPCQRENANYLSESFLCSIFLSYYGKSIFWELRTMRDTSKYCPAKKTPRIAAWVCRIVEKTVIPRPYLKGFIGHELISVTSFPLSTLSIYVTTIINLKHPNSYK